MTDRNEAVIIGRLAADPVIRNTKTGKAVATLRVATNIWNGKQEVTEFHNVIAWEKLADRVKNQKSGQRVVVIGRLATREYEDRSGAKRTTTEIVANVLELGIEEVAPPSAARPEVEDEDAIPF